MSKKLFVILLILPFITPKSIYIELEANTTCTKGIVDPSWSLEKQYEYCQDLEVEQEGHQCMVSIKKQKLEKHTEYICTEKDPEPIELEKEIDAFLKEHKEHTYYGLTFKDRHDKMHTVEAGKRWNLCSEMNTFNSDITKPDCLNAKPDINGFDCCFLNITYDGNKSNISCLLSNLNIKQRVMENIKKDAESKKINITSVDIDCEDNHQNICNDVQDSYNNLTVPQCNAHNVNNTSKKCCRVVKHIPSPRENPVYTCREYTANNENITREEIKEEMEGQKYTKYEVQCDEKGSEISVGDANVTCGTISQYLEHVEEKECFSASVPREPYKCCKITSELDTPDGPRKQDMCLSMIPIFEKNAEKQIKEGYRAMGYDIKNLNISCPGNKEEEKKTITCESLTDVNNLNEDDCINTLTTQNDTKCCFVSYNRTKTGDVINNINTCLPMRELGIIQAKEDFIEKIKKAGYTVLNAEVKCPSFGKEMFIRSKILAIIMGLALILF